MKKIYLSPFSYVIVPVCDFFFLRNLAVCKEEVDFPKVILIALKIF